MTKRIAYTTILLLFIASVFTGCAGSADSAKTETVNLKDLHTPDKDELKQMIDGLDNLSITDDITVIMPNTSHMYEYSNTSPKDIDMAKYDSDFRKMFEYLFPDHNLNEDYLLYEGGSSDLEYDDNGNILKNFNHVRDFKDDIVSGKEGRVAYLYDETWNTDTTTWKNQVCLEMGNPLGYGYATINKGVTVKECEHKVYDDQLGQERYPLLESYDPAEWLEYVATYPADSEVSYPLLNGEITIRKAVEFFENYVNTIPYPADPIANTRVLEVEVYKMTQDAYGYYFLTTMEYEGIYFDHMRNGTTYTQDFSDYASVGGYAFMAATNDVDVISGYYRDQNVEAPKSYETIIPLDNVLKIFSKWMSDEVVFDIERIEVVYTRKPKRDENGHYDIVDPEQFISPAWKITLYNPNNDYDFVCYIDAKDGENFRYYSTPANFHDFEEE